MTTYYVSRALIAAVLAALMAAFGLVWWGAALAGMVIFATFVLLARSGRYLVQPGGGLTPMRRDELSQAVNQRAGLNGFVALTLGLAGLTVYYGAVAHSSVPVFLVAVVLALGVVSYIITDYRLRRM